MATPLHLLIVEDSERDTNLLLRELRRGGIDAVFERVETAAEMAAALERQPWDLIIADYTLPSFSGPAALELLRQHDLDVPLIIVSGSISEEVAVACMKQGAADYLLKDRLGRLGEAVRQALEHRRLHEEKRHAEVALRAAEARLRTVVQSAPLVLFALDRAGIFTVYTGGGLAPLGWQPDDHLGKSIYVLYANQPHVLSYFRRALAGEAHTTTSERNGMILEQHWIPESNARGSVTGVIGVGIDVTQHVQAQEETERARAAAEELARLRSDLVTAVSHELRTPLTALVGYAELLQTSWMRITEPKRLGVIEQIVSAAHRQQRLVEDLLLVSRLETEVFALRCHPVLLAPLVQRAAEEVQGSYPGQSINLHGPPEQYVVADPERTLQILANLADNAAKYSPEGSPIEVSWGMEGMMAVVRVRDQGPGIPDKGRERLFTRFGRVPGSRVRAGRVGTGLGLYLCRRLAQAMSGELDLEATGPQGTTFRLRLPAGAD